MNKCSNCEGSGVFDYPCGFCSGSGEGMADGSRCVSCRGSGFERLACLECDGTGEIEEYDERQRLILTLLKDCTDVLADLGYPGYRTIAKVITGSEEIV